MTAGAVGLAAFALKFNDGPADHEFGTLVECGKDIFFSSDLLIHKSDYIRNA